MCSSHQAEPFSGSRPDHPKPPYEGTAHAQRRPIARYPAIHEPTAYPLQQLGKSHSQILCPLITVTNPAVEGLLVANPETDLERLGFGGQRRGDAVTPQGVQDGPVRRVFGGHKLKGHNHP